MVVYICQKCSKHFNHKGNYNSHVNRESDCYREEDVVVTCPECGKSFSRRDNMKRHQAVCDPIKTAQGLTLELKNKVMELEKTIQSIQENQVNNSLTVERAGTSIAVTNIENQFNHICNNTLNNNILVNFGTEDIRKLPLRETGRMTDGLHTGAKGINSYVEAIHLNDSLPENKNVFIRDMKSRRCKVIEDNKWVSRDVDDVIDRIIENGVSNIELILIENMINLSKNRIQSIRDILEVFELAKDDEDYIEHVDEIRHEIKSLLYKKRDRIQIDI